MTNLQTGGTWTEVPKSGTMITGFMKYTPTGYDPTQAYPLVVFIHGIGEVGDGTSADTGLKRLSPFLNSSTNQLKPGLDRIWTTASGEAFRFVAIAPQLKKTSPQINWSNSYIQPAINYIKSNMNIDASRVYFVGISWGGGGVWKYCATSLTNSQQFAAISPICGVNDMGSLNACNIAESKRPVWTFHAADDTKVYPSSTQTQVNKVNSCIPTPVPKVKFTKYDTGGHTIWRRVFNPTPPSTAPVGTNGEVDTFWSWLLKNKLGTAAIMPS